MTSFDSKDSSDAIIASLLDDFQKANEKFDVSALVKKGKKGKEVRDGSRDDKERDRDRKDKDSDKDKDKKGYRDDKDKKKHKKGKKSSRSRSKTPKRSKEREKKSKKDKKSKSKDVPEVKYSTMAGPSDANEVDDTADDLERLRAKLLRELKREDAREPEKKVDVKVLNSLEIEQVSDDELPVGSDAHSMNGPPPFPEAQKLSDYLREQGHRESDDDDFQLPNRKKVETEDSEFFPLCKSGDVFPLSKSGNDKKKKEIPMIKKPSEILTKVINKDRDKGSGFMMPRNLKKLKPVQDENVFEMDAKEAKEKQERKAEEIKDEALKKIQIMRGEQLEDDGVDLNVPKGPIRRKFGNDPCFPEEEQELQIAPITDKMQADAKKKIVIGSLKTDDIASRPTPVFRQPGEEGEIPRSDHEDNVDSSSDTDIGDTDGEILDSDGNMSTIGKVKRLKEAREREKKLVNKQPKKRARSRSRSESKSKGRSTKRSRRSSSRDKKRRDRDKKRSVSRSRSRSTSRGRSRRKGGRRGKKEPSESDKAQWPWGQGARNRSPGLRGGRGSRRLRRSSYSKSRSRSRSRSRDRRRRERERREKGGSPTPRDEDGHIDKKKLFDIARRNASAMLQVGTLQQLTSMSADEIAKLRSGGRSVDELVEYCKKLQKRQEKAKRREAGEHVTTSESEGDRSEDDLDFINHPFELKPNPGIILNIPRQWK